MQILVLLCMDEDRTGFEILDSLDALRYELLEEGHILRVALFTALPDTEVFSTSGEWMTRLGPGWSPRSVFTLFQSHSMQLLHLISPPEVAAEVFAAFSGRCPIVYTPLGTRVSETTRVNRSLVHLADVVFRQERWSKRLQRRGDGIAAALGGAYAASLRTFRNERGRCQTDLLQGQGTRRITMFVRNTAVHDSRVNRAASALAERGNEVTVIALAARGLRFREVKDGYGVVRISKGIGAWLADRGLPGLRKLFIHAKMIWRGLLTRAETYHAHDLNTLAIAWVCARLRRGRLVYDSHEVALCRSGSPPRLLDRVVERFLIRRADAVIYTTPMRADHIHRKYGIARPHVIRNVPKLTLVEKSDRLRRLAESPEGEVIILYQGGLMPHRGLERAVEAFSRVPRGILVFLGWGPEQDRVEALSRSLGVRDRVRFVPAVSLEELPALTAGADIGLQILENVNFNHYSTLSNKLFEYLMSGVPVVASDFPMIREVVETHRCGLLVDPHDVDSIARALNRLVQSPSLRETLAGNASSAALSLNWSLESLRLQEVYQGLE